MPDPFAFRNQKRQDRIAAQESAVASKKGGGGGGGGKKRRGRNNNNGGGNNNNGKNDGKKDNNDLTSSTNTQTWNEDPLTYMQFLGSQGGLATGTGGFGNFSDLLYSDIENRYNTALSTYKNNDLDFMDWLKRQDEYGNPMVSSANKDPNVQNAEDFAGFVRRKFYEASSRQRGADPVSYGAGSTRWSAF